METTKLVRRAVKLYPMNDYVDRRAVINLRKSWVRSILKLGKKWILSIDRDGAVLLVTCLVGIPAFCFYL